MKGATVLNKLLPGIPVLLLLCLIPGVFADSYTIEYEPQTVCQDIPNTNDCLTGGTGSDGVISRDSNRNRETYTYIEMDEYVGSTFSSANFSIDIQTASGDPSSYISLYYCNDVLRGDLNWNNKSNIANCGGTAFTQVDATTVVLNQYTSFDITNILNNDADKRLVLWARMTPPDMASVSKVYWYDFAVGNPPVVNFTIGGSISLDVFYESPGNNTRSDGILSVGYNVSRVANCSLFVNDSLEDIKFNAQANTTFYLNFTPITDGIYNYSINCSMSSGQYDDTKQYTWEYDTTAPFITYIFPLNDNSSIVAYNGSVNINVSCTDNNLYWSNFTVYRPDNSLYHNTETNISMAYTEYKQNLTINNITTSGEWEVYLQCWDGHTNSLFKVDNSEADKDTKLLTYTINEDIVNIQLTDSNKIEEFDTLTTTYLGDRYTFDYIFKDDLKKNTYFTFIVSTNGKEIKPQPLSKYQGHFIIGFDYWLDFAGIPADIEYIKINKTAVQVIVMLTETVLKDDLSFKSFGGLNYNEELAYFTVLATPSTPSNGTVSCEACLNLTINCTAIYPINSTGELIQTIFCENYLNSIEHNKLSMGYLALALIIVGTIYFLYRIADTIQFPYFDYPIAKHLIGLVAMWLILPLINIGIVLAQTYPTDYPLEGTLTTVYSAAMWILYIITAFYVLGLMFFAFKRFSEANK